MSTLHPSPISSIRLETFSDGVIAVVITIIVLELRVPGGADVASLGSLVPGFLAYALSFMGLGIYWNNHHHLLRSVKSLTPHIMWGNLILLFWLTLLPLSTQWLGIYFNQPLPVAMYGFILLLASITYGLLQSAILRQHEPESPLRQAIGRDIKGRMSTLFYALGVVFAFIWPPLAEVVYLSVAVMWFVPDRRLLRI